MRANLTPETMDTPAPALTAAEWERMRHEVPHGHHEPADRYWVERPTYIEYEEPMPAGELRAEVGPHNAYTALRTEVTLPPVPIMALANAALPDGHPAKLTADDAEWCRLLAGNHTVDFGELQTWAAQMRAKLVALLPPEGA